MNDIEIEEELQRISSQLYSLDASFNAYVQTLQFIFTFLLAYVVFAFLTWLSIERYRSGNSVIRAEAVKCCREIARRYAKYQRRKQRLATRKQRMNERAQRHALLFHK